MQTPFSLRVPFPIPIPNPSSILIRSDSDLPLQIHLLLSSQPLLFVTKTKWMFTLGLLFPLFWGLLPLGLLLLGFKLKCHSVGGASLTPGPLQTIVLYHISWFSPKSPFVHLYLKSPCLLSFVLTVALSWEWASPWLSCSLLSPPWPEWWHLACALPPKRLQNLCHALSAAPSPCLSRGLAVGDASQSSKLWVVFETWICQSSSFSSWPVRRKGSPREYGTFQILEEPTCLIQRGTVNTRLRN